VSRDGDETVAADGAVELERALADAGAPLAARMRSHRVPGLSVAVVDRGEIAWTHAWGSDPDHPTTRLAVDTRLLAGSISKPVAARVAIDLVDDGRLELDRSVNADLRRWRIPDAVHGRGEDITLRRLLSHTAGLSVPGFVGYAPGAALPDPVATLDGRPPANHDPVRIVAPPGEAFAYSGGGYAVLRVLLEDVTGQTFECLARERVLGPACMTSSDFDRPEASTLGPIGSGSMQLEPVPHFAYPELAAAGLVSTAPDLARLLLWLAERRDLLSKMVKPHAVARFDSLSAGVDTRVGLGVFTISGDEPGWLWHTGGNVGFSCMIVGTTTRPLRGVACMTNGFPGGRALGWEIVDAWARAARWQGWRDVAPTRPASPTPADG
jgi:CubicO group peptidase (beta-lactamase class C family)